MKSLGMAGLLGELLQRYCVLTVMLNRLIAIFGSSWLVSSFGWEGAVNS